MHEGGFALVREIKAKHLKARGDSSLKAGNYRDAWTRYVLLTQSNTTSALSFIFKSVEGMHGGQVRIRVLDCPGTL